MLSGWIKLHRKAMDSSVWTPNLWFVWSWCLMKASTRDRTVSMKISRGYTQVDIKRGQFVYGRLKASKELGLNQSTTRNLILKLKKLGNVDIQVDGQYSIITICNYDTYQNIENKKGQPSKQAKDKQRTSKGQAKDTVEELEELKEGKELREAHSFFSSELRPPYHEAKVTQALNNWFRWQASFGKIPFDIELAAQQMIQMTATPEELIESIGYGIANSCKNFVNFSQQQKVEQASRNGRYHTDLDDPIKYRSTVVKYN